MTNYKDLIKALHIIQDICKENTACETCPLTDPWNDGCYFTHYYPQGWDIKNASEINQVFNGKPSTCNKSDYYKPSKVSEVEKEN